jgi:hypothetical protein
MFGFSQSRQNRQAYSKLYGDRKRIVDANRCQINAKVGLAATITSSVPISDTKYNNKLSGRARSFSAIFVEIRYFFCFNGGTLFLASR